MTTQEIRAAIQLFCEANLAGSGFRLVSVDRTEIQNGEVWAAIISEDTSWAKPVLPISFKLNAVGNLAFMVSAVVEYKTQIQWLATSSVNAPAMFWMGLFRTLHTCNTTEMEAWGTVRTEAGVYTKKSLRYITFESMVRAVKSKDIEAVKYFNMWDVRTAAVTGRINPERGTPMEREIFMIREACKDTL